MKATEILIALTITMTVYMPLSHVLFDTSWAHLVERAYFFFFGAFIALWKCGAFRNAP